MTERALRPFDGVAVCAPITVPYVRHAPGLPAQTWLARALRALVEASGVSHREIDGLAVASFGLAADAPAAIVSHLGLDLSWFSYLPHGGACGVVALRRAARAVETGEARIVACIAGDGHERGAFRDLVADFTWSFQDAVWPYGAAGPNAIFAMITRAYMQTHGVDRAAFGRLAVQQRRHAMDNPLALLRDPLDLDDYLATRPIAEPLHLFDCVMPCAGAEGFLVMREDTAQRLGVRRARALAAVERHGAFASDPVQLRGGWEIEAERLFAAAGRGCRDVDLLQTYDDYPVISFLQMEGLGLAERGGAAALVESGATAIDGRLPHNTCGGQLSCGQAGAAGGFLGMVEAVRQLIGRPLGRAASPATTALVSGYGMIDYDRGLCTAAAILERVEKEAGA